MKKKIALLLFTILAALVLLAACGQTTPTKMYIRWAGDGSESYTFRVTLADFKEENNKKTELKGDKNVDFYKELSINGENLTNRDEIRPEAVDGTYYMQIKKADNSHWSLSVEQTLYAQYKKEDITLSDSELSTLKPSEDELAGTTLESNEALVTLKSVIKREVTFEDVASQTPTSSSVESNGFYIGKANQQLSSYTVKMTYDFSGKRPIASVSLNDGEATEYKQRRNAKFIDPNQLLLYLRSFDKTSDDFKDNPSVQMFDPLTGSLQTVSFALACDQALIITDSKRDPTEKCVSLNAVSVAVGGLPFMVEEDVPSSLAADKIMGEDKSKYTTVRFRSGYLSYELESYPQALWDGLSYPEA